MKSHSPPITNFWIVSLLAIILLIKNGPTLAQIVLQLPSMSISSYPSFPYNNFQTPLRLPQRPQGPREVYHSLVFEYGSIAPDNYVQDGILINGQFPGPQIRVHMYDILIVDVTNKLDHGISLYFHGIRNYGQPEADGTPYVTQELIPPGVIFRYIVNIGFQTGTFIYHLHTGLDSIFALGPLIIEDGTELLANQPDYYHFWEYTFILTQCWHTPISKLLEGLQGSPYKELPEPDSILINGQSFGVWEYSNGLTNGYEVIKVKPGVVYRFRVIGFGADSILSFNITGHKMKVIEVDGIITKPVEVDQLAVNSGQRYSVLVKMDQPVGNYFIESIMVPGPGPRNGKAILQYEGAPDPSPEMRKEYTPGKTEEAKLTAWVTSSFSPNPRIRQPDIYLPPTTVDKEIVIKSHQKKTPDNQVKFDINGKFYKDPVTPWLFQVRKGINITQEPLIYQSVTNKSIQIIFQNIASEDGKCTQHPWHVHGHSFYVVGAGAGEYDKSKDGNAINHRVESESQNLVFRDVVTLFPNVTDSGNDKGDNDTDKIKTSRNTSKSSSNTTPTPKPEPAIASPETLTKLTTTITSTISNSSMSQTKDLDKLSDGTPCGWVAIRFVTDNPGVWLVHCHLTAHLIMGKEFVIYSYQETNPTFTNPSSVG